MVTNYYMSIYILIAKVSYEHRMDVDILICVILIYVTGLIIVYFTKRKILIQNHWLLLCCWILQSVTINCLLGQMLFKLQKGYYFLPVEDEFKPRVTSSTRLVKGNLLSNILDFCHSRGQNKLKIYIIFVATNAVWKTVTKSRFLNIRDNKNASNSSCVYYLYSTYYYAYFWTWPEFASLTSELKGYLCHFPVTKKKLKISF